MAALALTPPHPGPWDTTREGGVKAADGVLIGYCRYERIGDLARMQAASRWFAASPSLVDAAIALVLAQDGLLAAHPDAVRLAGEARRVTLDALGRLRDPALVASAAANAEISALLVRLNRGVR